MATAEQIMEKKAFIRAEMEKQLSKAQSDELWEASTRRLEAILRQYDSLPKGVRIHTDSRIFPSAAIYLTAKPVVGPEKAYAIIENAAVQSCADIASKLARLMRVPGMRGLFVRVWDPLTKKIFGSSCGFENTFYPKEKGAYRMDVTACPYFRYYRNLAARS